MTRYPDFVNPNIKSQNRFSAFIIILLFSNGWNDRILFSSSIHTVFSSITSLFSFQQFTLPKSAWRLHYNYNVAMFISIGKFYRLMCLFIREKYSIGVNQIPFIYTSIDFVRTTTDTAPLHIGLYFKTSFSLAPAILSSKGNHAMYNTRILPFGFSIRKNRSIVCWRFTPVKFFSTINIFICYIHVPSVTPVLRLLTTVFFIITNCLSNVKNKEGLIQGNYTTLKTN